MNFIDSDGSGGISRGEFLEWIESGFTKEAKQLKKFAQQGKTETLLVDFLIGVIGHTHGWMGSFQTLFRGNEDGLTENKLWSTLQNGMTKARMFSNDNDSTAGVPPLYSILTLSTSNNDSPPLIQPQDACDFLVHMALHSTYRAHTVTSEQKQLYRTLLATVETGMFEKRTSAKTVTSNPLVVLACSAMFSTYDTSGDDVLDTAELRRMLNAVCADQKTGAPPERAAAQELLQVLDVDNDGMISREEFINAVLAMMHKEEKGGGGAAAAAEDGPTLSSQLEIGVVNLARQLERRRTMLHRLHKKYAKKDTIQLNQDGMFRLLRHCQRKQKIENKEANNAATMDGGEKRILFAKVTEAAVEAVMSVYQAAAKAAATSSASVVEVDNADNADTVGTENADKTPVELLLAPPTFSGPILLSSCMHPAQLDQQRMVSKNMNLVLDMYDLINSEVGRMVMEGDMKREKKRNAGRVSALQVQHDNSIVNELLSEDDSSSDDEGGGGSSFSKGSGGGTVDFGW